MNPVYSLQNINTWWKTGEVDPVYLHKRIRSEFTEILKSLGSNRITNIIGPCGVGKTALLYQTVNQLIRSQVPPQRIIFFGGDEMTLFGEHRSIGSMMEIFATDLLHENLFALKAPVYVLIDDIQLIDDWQIYLLNYMQKTTNIKFIIAQTLSGLSSREFPPDSDVKVSVMPLTQPQFAEFYGVYKNTDIDLIRFKSLLPGTSIFRDPKEYYEALSANIYPLGEFKPYKTKIMNEYLLCGGYPAYFGAVGFAQWQASLLEVIDRTLYCDIAAAYNIKSPQKLKKLLYFIATHSGREQSFGSIGRALYLDTSTIIGYISFLYNGGFAGVAENFSSNSTQDGRVIRKNKRFYIFDTGIGNALLRNTDINAKYGAFVAQSCSYMAHEYAKAAGGEIFFWKDGSREVDIVLSIENTLLPVSINFQLEYSDRCTKSLKVFMRLHGAKNAVIITKDVLKSEDGIFFIPHWMI
jgi:predicted AAA+ superfamily ATPase